MAALIRFRRFGVVSSLTVQRLFTQSFTHKITSNIASNTVKRVLKLLTALSGISVASYLYFEEKQNIFEKISKNVFQKALAAEAFTGSTPVDPGTRKSHQFNFIADTVEKVIPAVVYIEIEGRLPFHRNTQPVANGSGFIISSDGDVLSNAHVVMNQTRVKVRLHDGRTFEGAVISRDEEADLALIKINGSNLPTLNLADSSKVRAGEFVIAIGSPFSLSNTVTSGIVSNVQRGSSELGLRKGQEIDYIQTDASINFGNSGGPLVNLDGEVIGICAMKVTAGISFAIPSDLVKSFVKRSKEGQGSWLGVRSHSATQPQRYLGIRMFTLTPSILQSLQVKDAELATIDGGVYVHSVWVDSPAHRAGMRPDDIILKINGRDVRSTADVSAALEGTSKSLNIQAFRHGTTVTFNVTLK